MRISGGAITATALVYAPNSTVILQEGGMLNGAVVSHSFVASGGTLTKFKAVDEDTFLTASLMLGSAAPLVVQLQTDPGPAAACSTQNR